MSMKWGLLMLAWAVLVSGSLSFANTSYTIVRHEKEIYEVVVASDQNATTLEPGIYAIDRNGKSVPLLLGNVLGVNRSYKGMLSYSALNTQSSPTHDMLTIINGRLTFLNQKTNEKNPKSYRVLGGTGPSALVPVDAINGRPIQLPEITSLDDISYHTTMPTLGFPDGAQIFLLSLRLPSPMGDGLTMAMVLQRAESTGLVRVHENRAWVLGYEFLNESSLARLIENSSGIEVHAPSTIDRFKSFLERSKQKSPVAQTWAKHLENFQDYIRTGNKQYLAGDTMGVPMFSLNDGKESLEHVPFERMTSVDGLSLGESFNPLTDRAFVLRYDDSQLETVHVGSKKLEFIHSGELTRYGIAELKIDRYDNGKFKVVEQYQPKESDGQHPLKAYAYFRNNKLNLLAPIHADRYTNLEVPGEIEAKGPENLDVLSYREMKDGHQYHIYLLLARRGEKSHLHSFILREIAGGLMGMSYNKVWEGPRMSAEELAMRVVQHKEEMLVDLVTPVRGPAAYKKGAEQLGNNNPDAPTESVRYLRTTAYHRIVRLGRDSAETYLRPLSETEMVPGFLKYREYNTKGARVDASGFYATSVNGAKGDDESFLAGKPLMVQRDATGKALAQLITSRLLSSDGAEKHFPQVQFSLFPFSTKNPKAEATDSKRKSKTLDEYPFSMGVLLSPAWARGDGGDGVLRYIDFPLPYKTLSYVQILQGRKKKSHEVSILFAFKEDPNIPASADAMYVIPAEIGWDAAENGLRLYLGDLSKLHKNLVSVENLKNHLLTDAQGHIYWIDDPSTPKDSERFRVRRLSSSKETAVLRSSSLRELDDLSEDGMGYASRRSRSFARWEIYNSMYLRENVPGLKDYIQNQTVNKEEDGSKAKVKNGKGEVALLKAFDQYLDQLVNQTDVDGPRILIVEKEFKERFNMHMYARLAEGEGAFSLKNRNMRFFYANTALDDVEIAGELSDLADQKKSKKLLFVNHDLFKTEIVARPPRDESHSSDNEDQATFDPIEDDAKPNFLVLLASEGKAKSIKGFKKLKPKASRVSSVTLMTPNEWREILTNNQREVANGVLDHIQVDYRHMTSAWTMWPPGSESQPEDIANLLKSPYRPEEMGVFPNLDRLLQQAANGQMAGQQKIIVVPQELKEPILKLIQMRWLSTTGVAGSWSHQNPELALFKINAQPIKQHNVHDNYRAIWSVADQKNVVVLSDVESILKIGRVHAQEGTKAYRLRDPIARVNRGVLLDSLSKTAPPNQPANKPTTDLVSENLDLAQLTKELELVMAEIEDLSALHRKRKAQLAAAQLEARESKANTVVALKTDIAHVEERFVRATSLRQALNERIDSLRQNPSIDVVADEDQKTETQSIAPHMMWMVGAEGHFVQPSADTSWSLKQAASLRAATILIATEDELHRLESEMSFESRFFNVRQHFDVVDLEAPSEETKVRLVEQLFERPEIKSLNIKFHLNEDNGLDSKSQIIHHFVNRVDKLAYDQRIEKTSAFVRSFIALKNALAEDPDLRRHRQVDVRFIERLFHRVFSMEIDPNILEPTDWLKRIQDVDQTVRDLQSNGHEGSQDVKRTFINNVNNQTRPTDSSQPIPNSQIIFGGTGGGKTFLIHTFFKTLGLVEYNRQKPNNEEADFIFINCAKVTPDKTNGELDRISVDELIADITDFLSQPNGHRGHIVWDDFHKAPKGVRERLVQFIQALFEAPHGLITVKSKDGRRHREIPVKNLNIYKTVNPTANENIRKQYVKPSHEGRELLKREVLAAIAGDGFTPEESYLARWSAIIDMDKFPRSAKVPELVKRVRQSSSRGGQMVLVDPLVIDTLIDKFPGAHARELLAPATAALTQIPSSAEKAPIYIVTKRDAKSETGGGIPYHDLQQSAREFTQIDPIRNNDPASLLRLMGFIMRNFRLQLYNFMSLEAHMTDTLRLDRPGYFNFLKSNFLFAVSTHVKQHPRLSDGEIIIRPEQFSFYSRSQMEELIKLAHDSREKSPKHFPFNMDIAERSLTLDLDSFIKGHAVDTQTSRSRRDVVMEISGRIEQLLRKAMRTYLRLESVEDLKEIGHWNEAKLREWYQRLSEADEDKEFRTLMQEMLTLFFEFQDRLTASDLIDFKQEGEALRFNLFDQSRLFAYALDKAVVRLPWGQIGNFALNVAKASSDYSLGTRASYREFVGTHQLSPFSIATTEFMNEMYVTSLTLGQDLSPKVGDLNRHFGQVCEYLLTDIKGSEGK